MHTSFVVMSIVLSLFLLYIITDEPKHTRRVGVIVYWTRE